MKQRITEEQVKSLSIEQRRKLVELWTPDLGDWIYDNKEDEVAIVCGTEGKTPEVIHGTWYTGGDFVSKVNNNILPLMTIGQMIQHLYNCHTCVSIEVGTQGFFSAIKAGVNNKQTDEELCDALWEGTKKMLDVLISLDGKKN